MSRKWMVKPRSCILFMIAVVLICISACLFMTCNGSVMHVYAGEELKSDEKTNVDKQADQYPETGTDSYPENISSFQKDTKTDTEENKKEAYGTAAVKECICQDRCVPNSLNTDCGICSDGYTNCRYKMPNVKITIKTPEGWHNKNAKVAISVTDTKKSGNFIIQTIQAKISHNGSWMDITEDRFVEISEDSTVYILVTDQNGRTYEKSRHIHCFDFEAPVINSAVSDGMLSIRAYDTDSGVRAVYVNGYEFAEPAGGILNIRLQQFDAGYQYFTMQAADYAGNISEVYKTANPYYKDQDAVDSGEDSETANLPLSAEATDLSSATAQVVQHTVTDNNGDITKEISGEGKDLADKKKTKKTSADSKAKYKNEENKVQDNNGREFYTIQTDSEKVFYLVIDRKGNNEEVYFLTEISENDLLHVTTDNSRTMPKNSAVLESGMSASGNDFSERSVKNDESGQTDQIMEETSGDDTKDAENADDNLSENNRKENPAAAYVIIGILAAGIVGVRFYLKSVHEKKEAFLDEEDDEDDETYEDDEGDDLYDEEMEDQEDSMYH